MPILSPGLQPCPLGKGHATAQTHVSLVACSCHFKDPRQQLAIKRICIEDMLDLYPARRTHASSFMSEHLQGTLRLREH
jgi:hypothetical protein